MGNRAVIAFDTAKSAPCIYLHWNGGRASVEAFLEAAKLLGLKEVKRGEEAAALDWIAETLAKNFFGCKVGTTVYREQYGRSDCDNGDNGVYVINSKLEIVERRFNSGPEEVAPEKTSEIKDQILSTADRYPNEQQDAPVEQKGTYIVLCLDDDMKVTIAKSFLFSTEEEAKAYATTVAPGRLAQVYKAV